MNAQENNQKNIAYIDGANLHKGILSLGWKLDYRRLHSWIRQKFGVNDAKLFIGMMQTNASLYTFLQNAGYRLIFKEVVFDEKGKAKGNCDADLVLQAVIDFYENRVASAILISSDGDYTPLIKFWIEKGVRCTILSPAPVSKCSILLKKTDTPIVYLDEVKKKINIRQK